MARKNWIAGAVKHKGGLHKSLGIDMDKPIPIDVMEKAMKRKGKVGKQARLANTLRHLRIVAFLATLFLAPLAARAEQMGYQGSWILFGNYRIFEPFYLIGPPDITYIEHTAEATDQTCSPIAPFTLVTRRVANDDWHYYDNDTAVKVLKQYHFTHDTYNWADYLQQPPGFSHTRIYNWTGTTITTTDTNYNAIGAPIQISPLHQATYSRPIQYIGYQPGTTETGTFNGRQYVRIVGTGTALVTLHIATTIDSVLGHSFAPHFYRINTGDSINVHGKTSAPFNDATGNVDVNMTAGWWYDVTPSYVNPPAQYDFSYIISVQSALRQ